MAQSLANILLHIVFSTKQREPFIDAGIEAELFQCLSAVGSTLGCPFHAIGGSDDHVHIACSLNRIVTVSHLVQSLKQDSSKWMKTLGPQYAEFKWQSGFSTFSVGQSQLDDLREFIVNQREHHRRESFQDEYRRLLDLYRVPYDEKLVWD